MGAGGGRCPEPPGPPLDPPLFCMNARPHHGTIAGFPWKSVAFDKARHLGAKITPVSNLVALTKFPYLS